MIESCSKCGHTHVYICGRHSRAGECRHHSNPLQAKSIWVVVERGPIQVQPIYGRTWRLCFPRVWPMFIFICALFDQVWAGLAFMSLRDLQRPLEWLWGMRGWLVRKPIWTCNLGLDLNPGHFKVVTSESGTIQHISYVNFDFYCSFQEYWLLSCQNLWSAFLITSSQITCISNTRILIGDSETYGMMALQLRFVALSSAPACKMAKLAFFNLALEQDEAVVVARDLCGPRCSQTAASLNHLSFKRYHTAIGLWCWILSIYGFRYGTILLYFVIHSNIKRSCSCFRFNTSHTHLYRCTRSISGRTQ